MTHGDAFAPLPLGSARQSERPTRSVPEGPLVVVLLATYNGAEHLDEQLDSILGQRDVDLRLVVSDDGSTDGTVALLRARTERDTRVVMLPARRSGSSSANFLRLIREAPIDDADHVAFSDQDDIWPADKLTRALTVLAHPDVDGYSADVIAFYPDGRERKVVKSQLQRRWDYLFSSAGPGCTYVVSAAPMRRLRERLGEVPEAAEEVEFHDWLVYAWFRQAGYGWYIDPLPAMHYRQHDRNVLGANVGVSAAIRRARQTFGGGPFGQVLALAEVVKAHDELPVRLLASGRRVDLLRLAALAGRLRRTRGDGLGLALLLIARAARPGRASVGARFAVRPPSR